MNLCWQKITTVQRCKFSCVQFVTPKVSQPPENNCAHVLVQIMPQNKFLHTLKVGIVTSSLWLQAHIPYVSVFWGEKVQTVEQSAVPVQLCSLFCHHPASCQNSSWAQAMLAMIDEVQIHCPWANCFESPSCTGNSFLCWRELLTQPAIFMVCLCNSAPPFY